MNLLRIFLLLLGLGAACAADRPSGLALPPWFDHGMVLQQREVDRRDNQPLLWGWAATYEDVYVELPGQPRRIRTRVIRRDGRGLELWQLQANQLEAPLQPLAPGISSSIRIRAEGAAKAPQERVITNVVIGDVWVVGAGPGAGLPVVEPDTNRLANLRGRLRILPVNDLVWTNWIPGGGSSALNSGWQVLDAASADRRYLPAVVEYFGLAALEATPGVPVGIILAPPSTLVPPWVKNQRLAGMDDWTPAMRRGIAAADAASALSVRDSERAQEVFKVQMKQAKRRGEIAADLGLIRPPPAIPLRQACAGPIPSLGYGVAGACWGR